MFFRCRRKTGESNCVATSGRRLGERVNGASCHPHMHTFPQLVLEHPQEEGADVWCLLWELYI